MHGKSLTAKWAAFAAMGGKRVAYITADKGVAKKELAAELPENVWPIGLKVIDVSVGGYRGYEPTGYFIDDDID